MNNEYRIGEKQLDTSGRIRQVAAAAVSAALYLDECDFS